MFALIALGALAAVLAVLLLSPQPRAGRCRAVAERLEAVAAPATWPND